MRICPYCKKTTNDDVNFCSSCGAQMVEAYPPQQPDYSQRPVQPENKAPSLGKVITGMALSIAGISFAAINLLYVTLFLIESGETAFVFSLVMSMFSLPLSIVGLKLSASSIAEGSTSNMASVGKRLGIIGIILTGSALFLGFVGLGAGDESLFI